MLNPFLLALSLSAASAGAEFQQADFVIYHPVRPSNVVYGVEASCGRHRFGVTLRGRHEDWNRRLDSVRADGIEIADRVRAAIFEHMRPGTIIMDADLDRCIRSRATKLRLRLQLIDWPDVERMRLLDIWIGPDGDVSDVLLNRIVSTRTMPAKDWLPPSHPMSPSDIVESKEASCGNEAFGLTLRHASENWLQRLHSVRVNGLEIVDAVRAAALDRIGPVRGLEAASFRQCTREGPTKVRLQLLLDWPERDRSRHLSLWIDAEGNVSEVDFN